MATQALTLTLLTLACLQAVSAAPASTNKNLGTTTRATKHRIWKKKLSKRTGDVCAHVGAACGIGRVCAGDDLQCVNPMGVGEGCGQDPYWVCQIGVTCIGGVCTNAPPADCSTTGCTAGHVCAGGAGALQCVTPMDEGGACGQDPYWVCRTGLDCSGGVCQNPVPQDCGTTGCPAGQVCAGGAGALLCVTPMDEGGACGQDPYWVCRTGLDCSGGVCKNPVPQDCGTTGCPAGQVCAGSAGALQCVMPMDEGGACGQDPYWVCRTGLDCTGGVCRNPVPQDCGTTGCPAEQVCAGGTGVLQCVTPMDEGGACGQDPYWVCRAGLDCSGGVCQNPVPQDCGTIGCPAGQICAGDAGALQCVVPMTEGGACGQDPYWVCAVGLICEHNVCKNVVWWFGWWR